LVETGLPVKRENAASMEVQFCDEHGRRRDAGSGDEGSEINHQRPRGSAVMVDQWAELDWADLEVN
jgi:hypothetical protein